MSKRARTGSVRAVRAIPMDVTYQRMPQRRKSYRAKNQGEMKYFDSSIAGVAIVATAANWAGTELDPSADPVASINTLFAPVQGSGINNRLGREAKVFKIKMNCILDVPRQATQSAAWEPVAIRIILFQDMQTNSTQAQGEELMATPVSANAFNTNAVFQSLGNFGRFKVLKDKKMILQNGDIQGISGSMFKNGMMRFFKMNHTFKSPVSVRFNATNGGTIADIVDNSFHIIAHATDISEAPVLTYQCRVCFKE